MEVFYKKDKFLYNQQEILFWFSQNQKCGREIKIKKSKKDFVVSWHNKFPKNILHFGLVYDIIVTMEKLKYSRKFITKCKKAYPHAKELHELLKNGDPFVGRILDDKRYASMGVSNEKVLAAKSLDELQAIAKQNHSAVDLYSDWCDEYASAKQQDAERSL